MKKKVLALCLFVFILCSVCACGNNENDQYQENSKQPVDNQTEEKSIITEYDGQPAIEEEYFGELLEVVELTTENWRQHFKVVTYTEDKVYYDPFGELVKDEDGNVKHDYFPHTALVANTDGYFYFNNVIIELVKKETDESIIFTISGSGKELYASINLDDYYCTRVVGDIILVNLPEEAICTPLEAWGYECGFQLEGSGCTPYRINQYTKGIYQNGSGDWKEQYIR